MDQRRLDIGQQVVYHDSRNQPLTALVTAIWGGQPLEQDGSGYPEAALVGGKHSVPCINLVMVSPDKDRQDTYGRQIERETSVVHASDQPAHGCYWRFEDEEPNPFTAAIS